LVIFQKFSQKKFFSLILLLFIHKIFFRKKFLNFSEIFINDNLLICDHKQVIPNFKILLIKIIQVGIIFDSQSEPFLKYMHYIN